MSIKSDNYAVARKRLDEAKAQFNDPGTKPPRQPPLEPPTRQGQREIVAATLAAGVIAASRERITVEQAAAKFREVLERLGRTDE